MRDNWDNIDPSNSRGPVSFGLKLILILAILSAGIGAAGFVLGWFGEAAQVTQQEVGPKALLAKYKWFKDTAAELDAKQANITAMEARVTALQGQYLDAAGKPLPRNQWSRPDAEQYNQWLSEVAGLKANYNSLAAEYNANMAKINFAFTNVGDMPKGADKVLPREYRSYQ